MPSSPAASDLRAGLLDAATTARMILDGASPTLRRLVWLLSVSLESTADDLAQLAMRVWPDAESQSHWDRCVQGLDAWSFVERTAGGWRALGDIAPIVARDFRAIDPGAFVKAHDLLVSQERDRLADGSSDDIDDDGSTAWFVRSRLAFYLAGTLPGESVEEFSVAFDTAPVDDAQIARMWLSTLVLRQEDLLHEYRRVVTFFQGFRAYVSKNYVTAVRLFRAVIDSPANDRYHAIALHLLAMSLPRDNGVRSGLLESSIQLSRDLSLNQNEIMARNSLVYCHMESAMRAAEEHRDDDVQPFLDRAEEAAKENVERAASLNDKAYMTYAIAARGMATWGAFAGVSKERVQAPGAGVVAEAALADFRTAVDLADQCGLRDSALYALNQRAVVLRDVGHPELALESLEVAAARVTRWSDRRAVSKLQKTLRSIGRKLPESLARRWALVEERLDA